jgi:hypothetical protein
MTRSSLNGFLDPFWWLNFIIVYSIECAVMSATEIKKKLSKTDVIWPSRSDKIRKNRQDRLFEVQKEMSTDKK